MEKRIQTVIEEHEQDTSPSWFSTAIGLIVALIMVFIGIYVLSSVMNMSSGLTSTNWMP